MPAPSWGSDGGPTGKPGVVQREGTATCQRGKSPGTRSTNPGKAGGARALGCPATPVPPSSRLLLEAVRINKGPKVRGSPQGPAGSTPLRATGWSACSDQSNRDSTQMGQNWQQNRWFTPRHAPSGAAGSRRPVMSPEGLLLLPLIFLKARPSLERFLLRRQPCTPVLSSCGGLLLCGCLQPSSEPSIRPLLYDPLGPVPPPGEAVFLFSTLRAWWLCCLLRNPPGP